LGSNRFEEFPKPNFVTPTMTSFGISVNFIVLPPFDFPLLG